MIKINAISLVASFSFIFSFIHAQCPTKTLPYDAVSIPREHNIDVERMRLEVRFKPEKGIVDGNVTHFFTPLRDKVDSIYFDGPGILIKKVTLNGQEIQFKNQELGFTFYTGKSLTWGEKDSINIQYEATPKKGLYFIGWNDTRNLSRKQIWSQGQAFDNRHWIPCFDLANDKLITEVIVHFDSEYKVLSNGNKISEKRNPDNTTTWHYKITNPHPTYLVMLGIGKYDIREETSASGIPMYQWYYPEWKNRVDATYKYSKKIFDFLESEIRIPYPWQTYSQIPVQDFMYGAMENTTATIFGDFFHVDNTSFNDGNYVGVNAHELAHQWFGDLVTARTVTHLWLQESFATHYNLLAERECFGIDHFDWARRQATNAALNTADKKPLAFSDVSNSIVYQKGSQVLEMLKYVIGREAYNRGIKRYLTDHKYANVDSEDLLNAFHDELGLSLEWFWEEWIYKGGEPSYKVDYKELKNSNNQKVTEITVNQTQANNDPTALFKMPIEFEVFYKDGSSDKQTAWIEKQTHIVSIPNTANKKIDFVLFDPNSRVVKTVNFTKNFEELSAQAEKAPNMIDRYDAVVALKGTSIKNKIALFEKLYDLNSFYGIKTEIINQLIDDTSKRSLNLIKKSLEDKDIKVRKELANITKTIHPSLEDTYSKLLQDSSYQLIGTAIEKLYQNFPEKADTYIALTKDIEGTNGRNVRIKWLRMAYNHTHKQEYLDQLVDYTSGSYEFLTRVNAMTLLRRINYFNEQLLNNCIDAAIKSNSRLANPAKEAITYYYNQDANKMLIKNTINALQIEKATKDMLRKLLQS